jgi:uncharacterized membrane protein YsdA (DUF1294 family)
MLVDKLKAIYHKYRISEVTLLTTSFLGGSIGGFLGMFLFRHKIRKLYFHFVFFISLIIHILLIWNIIK